MKQYLKSLINKMQRNMGDLAGVSFDRLGIAALVIVIVILSAYLGITVLSSLLPTFASSVKNLSENFTVADWGNATANSLGPIFGLVLSLLGMFAVVGLAFYVMKIRSGKGGV